MQCKMQTEFKGNLEILEYVEFHWRQGWWTVGIICKLINKGWPVDVELAESRIEKENTSKVEDRIGSSEVNYLNTKI